MDLSEAHVLRVYLEIALRLQIGESSTWNVNCSFLFAKIMATDADANAFAVVYIELF